MSYQVLARKWRPANFKQMVGQEHVLQALVNALDSNRLHHAYLFTGTRGVGKTTIARIFAKSLNCEQGISSEPCGSCSSCIEIDEGRSVDLIEIDAASRTGVDDMRELLDNVQYAPTRGRFKIYLIDEVVDPSNIKKVMRRYWQDIFEEQLNAWMRAPESWPKQRTLVVFLQWFDIEICDIVTDLSHLPMHYE